MVLNTMLAIICSFVELVSTFLDFVSKKVSEISTVHSSTTHHKRGFSSTESIPSTSDPHSHNNEAIDTATKVAIAFRQGTSTPLHARPLPMYIAADVQAVTQSWRKSVRKKPVTSSSRSHASESDYWAALDCLSSSNLLSVEIQTQNFPKVIGDCLAMVGVHRLNKEVVSVAAMKELQRQILPFDFSSSSRFSADASDCYSNSPSTFSGQNVLAQGNSNDRTGQTADDEAHVVENIDDSDSSDSVQPRTVPPVAEHQPILTARRPMLQAPSQRNGSEAVQSSNPSQQLNMNHVRAHAKQMLARHRRGMERRAGDQQIKRVPLSRYFERLRHAVPQGTTSSPETRDLNTAKDYAALLYDSLPIPAQQRNSVFAERFGFQRPTTSANRVCAINERDENQHDNRAEADAFDSGSPMEHYDSTTELVDYRLLTDTDLQGCFDDDEMAVNNRVEQELHRVEARRQQSKKFDYQPVALYRDTESAQKQKTTLNQVCASGSQYDSLTGACIL